MNYNNNPSDIIYLYVEAEVRYWEDASVNDKEDTEGTLIPFRVGDIWKPIIRVEDGYIVNWPKNTTADIHYKVCDQGEYWLGNDKEKLYKYDGQYVPGYFLCHGSEGYGDYIIFKVNKDGYIIDYIKPTIDLDRWKRI
jgi:hypothetical protein